jgi:hypothetical protein
MGSGRLSALGDLTTARVLSSYSLITSAIGFGHVVNKNAALSPFSLYLSTAHVRFGSIAIEREGPRNGRSYADSDLIAALR